MKFYDSFHPDLVDQAVAKGIFEYEENPELHNLFNDKEKEIIGILRTIMYCSSFHAPAIHFACHDRSNNK